MRIVKAFFVLFCSILNTGMLYADNGTKQTLIESWQFRRDHDMNAEGGWQNVTVPHDWAIYGPFDRANDLQDVVYVTVSVVDRSGIECPRQSNLVKVGVSGSGSFEALANGDPTCLEPFQQPQMHLFSGKLTAIVRRTGDGPVSVRVSAQGLKPCSLEIK